MMNTPAEFVLDPLQSLIVVLIILGVALVIRILVRRNEKSGRQPWEILPPAERNGPKPSRHDLQVRRRLEEESIELDGAWLGIFGIVNRICDRYALTRTQFVSDLEEALTSLYDGGRILIMPASGEGEVDLCPGRPRDEEG